MAKFKALFAGYSEDLVRVVGMSMNSLIRRIADENEAKSVKSTFLTPETATPEWLFDNIVGQVAVALFQRPKENRSINELALKVIERYRGDIEGWIEENKANLAEIGFLFPKEDNVITASPPVQNFAPRLPGQQPVAIIPPPTAVVPPPAPGANVTGFICRRGRR